jgi:uncharacterized membrane protein YedE/YeeE
METLVEQYGESALMLALGLIVGLVFGFAAYRSRFCLRAATVEVAEGSFGPKLTIWLTAFMTALVSVSGAIVGGLMFGAGMILARGCASRLLVLSASGNLRAIVTGLILTLTAQASLRGVLSPAREAIASLWTVTGGNARVLLNHESVFFPALLVFCVLFLMAVLAMGHKRGASVGTLVAASLVGFVVYVGWQVTYLISAVSFEIVQVQSVTFTGPSTDTLMALVNARSIPAGFGVGLVPGVFIGAMAAALLKGEARLQRFEPDTPMERYLLGGVLMGFGSMLAGGCAVGAGLSGGAIFATTAWLAVFFMWVGAMSTHWLMTLQAQQKLA